MARATSNSRAYWLEQVQVTESKIDTSKSWQIALQAPIKSGSLVFSGFTALSSSVPFDHTQPPATIKVHAKVVHDRNPKGYPKGHVMCLRARSHHP